MARAARAPIGPLLNAQQARVAVAVVFTANGFAFASWVSRIPAVRQLLDLDAGQLGLLLLALSVGSLLGLPTAGRLVQWRGAPVVVRAGASLVAVGVLGVALGAENWGSWYVVAASLALTGFGVGIWDVAMNLEGARVEQALGRTIMPRFHAGFSLGTVLGALAGAGAAWAGVAVTLHLGTAGLLAGVVAAVAARGFTPSPERVAEEHAVGLLEAWTEPRTLMLGLMVLALALTEGTANDWLAVALIDGYALPEWAGVAGFAVFVSAMTVGRLVGPVLLDRFGRPALLWSTMAAAGVGVLLVVLGGSPWIAIGGAVIWGLGASLGFPVGMSAAADDPQRAAARVSVVSTIGYTAFLAGPPLLGFVADRVGTLEALLVVAILLVPSALVVPAARPVAQRR